MNAGEPLRLILSAPFRTNIEMDTFSALSAAEVGNRIRKVTADLSSTEREGGHWTTEWNLGRSDGLLFASLDQHVIPQKAKATKDMSRTSFSDDALGELRDHVVVMEGEFEDCRLGLQGHMREVALCLLKVWDYDALASSVAHRSASLETAWSLLREKRRRRYDRALQFALTVIAGIAVIQFLLDLIAIAGGGTVPEDSVPGLIDAARLLSPDLTLYAAVFLILVLALLGNRGRK